MDMRVLVSVMLGVVALLIGFAFTYVSGDSLLDFGIISPEFLLNPLPISIMVFGVFLAGVVFFGYLAFVPCIFFGMQLGITKNAAIFLYLLPMILALYAGTKLGFSLKDDFNQKKVFLNIGKKVLLYIIFATLLAILFEFIFPIIAQYWPQNLFGMDMARGRTISDLLKDLSSKIIW